MPKSHSGIKRGHGKREESTLSPVVTYKEFDTVPKGYGIKTDTWDYGDGEDAYDVIGWFLANSNAYDIFGDMSEADTSALEEYTAGAFMDGQQYKGFSSMSAEEQNWTRTYDRLLDQSVINANVKLTRFSTPELLFGGGVKTTTLVELQTMKGKVITSKANLSTAAAKVGLSIGDGTKQIEYKIHIPAKTKGAGSYIGFPGRMHSYGVIQREFMLNRDTNWRVGDSRYDAKRKIFEVDLFFDSLSPHDYK